MIDKWDKDARITDAYDRRARIIDKCKRILKRKECKNIDLCVNGTRMIDKCDKGDKINNKLT